MMKSFLINLHEILQALFASGPIPALNLVSISRVRPFDDLEFRN